MLPPSLITFRACFLQLSIPVLTFPPHNICNHLQTQTNKTSFLPLLPFLCYEVADIFAHIHIVCVCISLDFVFFLFCCLYHNVFRFHFITSQSYSNGIFYHQEQILFLPLQIACQNRVLCVRQV